MRSHLPLGYPLWILSPPHFLHLVSPARLVVIKYRVSKGKWRVGAGIVFFLLFFQQGELGEP